MRRRKRDHVWVVTALGITPYVDWTTAISTLLASSTHELTGHEMTRHGHEGTTEWTRNAVIMRGFAAPDGTAGDLELVISYNVAYLCVNGVSALVPTS